MVFERYIPSYPLDSYVESILYLEGNSQGIGLPKTAMSLVFNLADSFKLFTDASFSIYTHYQKYWLAGFQLKPRHVQSYGQSKMIVVQFKTIGAFAFVKEALHHFTDAYIPLDDIQKYKIEETWEKLQVCTTLKEKFLTTEHFLNQCLLTKLQPHIKLLQSVNLIIQKNTNVTIEGLCKEVSISRKHLNHLFKEYVGVSPKTLTTLYRFQKSLQQLSPHKSESLTTFAYTMDYFDQAHFNHEFKKLSGIRPSEYLKYKEKAPSMQFVPHFLPKLD
ncbi:MAG: AraC family transcriptional regulator [Bacteroidetes bacterium]|nr:MAG: AraC family transcriptional regulator [Bacteroidota bacterium]